ncbi:MAG: DUF4340 domain-containing protein [Gammaproteobacteria bacterium]|nr:DUF4340 domain-containing protein [Gammaproteobacteria bacterium]
MKNRLIALALLAACIVALVLVFSLRGGPDRPPAVPLTHMAPATVTRIEVHKLGRPVMTLHQRAVGWWMLAPQSAPAEAARVQRLLAALGELTARQYPADSIDLAAVGLNPPAWTLIVNNTRIDFGSLNPSSLLRYVRRGDAVYMVMDSIAPLLAGGANAFLAPAPTSAAHAGTARG